ncbi:uncharacterized protein E0L32_004545 [Thyridium curvatum]|uniref:AB hydrolase-1 domain-containing protein n=1 Tax=Thyridium curvatum TaxID=1093900 RepID=A0A507BEQ7_9PEZI|nr:uncharacterized protein E0L32_004545 [Thyridium curvatum]TPX15268.1 hypothetical protein E0L32_004545 [Thyridium curvatum]
MLLTKEINGIEICYDESGFASGPAVVLLSGWAHDLRLYNEMLPLLAPNHWVIRVCYRGHGPSRDTIADFGVEEQFHDTVALLDSLGVNQMYLVSHSHGGWPALEMADRLGKSRVLCLLMIDQIMTPPPPQFAAGLQAMQQKETWRAARQGLFQDWLAGSDSKPVKDHFLYCMGSYGYEMWSLSCRVIAAAYGAHGSPMGRMAKIASPPPIRHVFSHPLDSPEYRQLHEKFAQEHPWFSYTDLKGETHFPDLEIPDRVVEQLEDLINSAGS